MQTMKLLLLGWVIWGLSACKTTPNVFQQKLQAISQTLTQPRPALLKHNEKIITAIKADVRKQGNSREGLERIKRCNILHTRTLVLIDTLQLFKGKLNNQTPAATTPVRQLLWHNEEGRKLAIKVNKYITWLGYEFKDLRLPKFELITTRHFAVKEEQQHPDKFAQLHFAYGSVATVRALLTFWQNTLLEYEREILKKLGSGDLCASMCCYGCGGVEARVSTQSDIIRLGEVYEAKMFVSTNASRANPRATYNGSPIMVKDGRGEVRVKVKPIPDSIKADKVTRFWKGSITFKTKGRDTTLSLRVPYTVLRKSVYDPSLQKNKK
ncbi:hypothetical protein BKI52_14545 [marine bacterium AO1-C]|nr:hypothetical protein BKI52_14545 [marine bacterium AO1-C]